MTRRTMMAAGLAGAGVFGIMIASAAPPSKTGFDAEIARHGQAMLEEGKKTNQPVKLNPASIDVEVMGKSNVISVISFSKKCCGSPVSLVRRYSM